MIYLYHLRVYTRLSLLSSRKTDLVLPSPVFYANRRVPRRLTARLDLNCRRCRDHFSPIVTFVRFERVGAPSRLVSSLGSTSSIRFVLLALPVPFTIDIRINDLGPRFRLLKVHSTHTCIRNTRNRDVWVFDVRSPISFTTLTIVVSPRFLAWSSAIRRFKRSSVSARQIVRSTLNRTARLFAKVFRSRARDARPRSRNTMTRRPFDG